MEDTESTEEEAIGNALPRSDSGFREGKICAAFVGVTF
jgi:hypothetical protein